MKMISTLSLAASSLLVIFLTGCGDKTPPAEKYPVSGTVMLGDKPLEKGVIVFDPADGKGTSYPGDIVDGKFSFESSEGKKIVRISSMVETGQKDQYGEPEKRSIIPEEYNSKSTTEAEVTKDPEMNMYEFKVPEAQ